MSNAVFSLGFIVLALAMTLWVDARFRGLTPSDLRTGAIRLVVAFVLAQLAVPAARWIADPLPAAVSAWLLLGAGFAAMVFLMLAALWMLRLAHGLLGGMLR